MLPAVCPPQAHTRKGHLAMGEPREVPKEQTTEAQQRPQHQKKAASHKPRGEQALGLPVNGQLAVGVTGDLRSPESVGDTWQAKSRSHADEKKRSRQKGGSLEGIEITEASVREIPKTETPSVWCCSR